MMNKTEVMKDLKFCQELMNRLIQLSDRELEPQYGYIDRHTVIQADIIRLRRELNEIRKKLEE